MDYDYPGEDDPIFDAFDPDHDSEVPAPPRWRRPLIVGVAVLTALAMAALPIYNLIGGSQKTIADNGLEVCGFDYCIVQDAMIEAGLDLKMSRFANMYLDDTSAAQLTTLLVDYLKVENVEVVVVDRLEGQIEGQYDSSTRTILVERPARAWTVMHEMAHVLFPGHGDDFQAALMDLAIWLDQALVD